jgi:two-component system OmpR family sensor kinase/two-component system sensor histidine kinase QseC
MNWSLQTRLARWLVAAIVLAGLTAAAVSYLWALDEAHEMQDQQLAQVAAVLRASRSINLDASAPANADIDAEAHLLIQALTHSIFPATLTPGFHTLQVHGEGWRVLVIRTRQEPVAVAQRTAWRDEAAQGSALRTLVPIFALIPLLLLAVAWAVRANFRPVVALAASLDARDEFNLGILPDTGLAIEIAPFIASINALLLRLDTALNQQRRFIADAAHELRTPLAALTLQAQNLEQAQSPDDMRARLKPLQAGLVRSVQLLEQLLSLARQQNLPFVGKQSIDVESIMRQVVGDLYPVAEARNIDLGMTALSPITLPGSPEALYILLRNAVDNAVRYTPDGGRVDVRLRVDENAATLEVEDTGPGIAEAERARVFEAFYRMSGARGEGSGLGLAIVHAAAQQLGGSVSLHPADLGGLIFRYCQRR